MSGERILTPQKRVIVGPPAKRFDGLGSSREHHVNFRATAIRAATIHPYIDETQYESQRYRIDTQAQYLLIFSWKSMRNFDGKTKFLCPQL